MKVLDYMSCSVEEIEQACDEYVNEYLAGDVGTRYVPFMGHVKTETLSLGDPFFGDDIRGEHD